MSPSACGQACCTRRVGFPRLPGRSLCLWWRGTPSRVCLVQSFAIQNAASGHCIRSCNGFSCRSRSTQHWTCLLSLCSSAGFVLSLDLSCWNLACRWLHQAAFPAVRNSRRASRARCALPSYWLEVRKTFLSFPAIVRDLGINRDSQFVHFF